MNVSTHGLLKHYKQYVFRVMIHFFIPMGVMGMVFLCFMKSDVFLSRKYINKSTPGDNTALVTLGLRVIRFVGFKF